MRYVLYPNQTPRKVVSMRLYIGSGSLQETDAQQGLAHFLEHMAFNGTRHFPAGEMVEYFQRIGMAFGSDTNAHTGFDETVYKLNLPDSNAKTVEDSLTLLRDYADGMLLEEKEINRERGVILSEKRTRDTPDYRQAEDFYKFLFEGHRLSERLPIGSESVIKTASPDLFRDFYARWYRPERMVLAVVGDFDVERMRAEVLRIFDGPFEGKTPKESAENLGSFIESGPIRVRFFPESQAQAVSISFVALRGEGKGGIPASDSLEKRVRRLYLDAALKIIQTRLRRDLQQADTPISEADAYRWPLPVHSGELLSLSAECKPENWQRAVALLETQLRRALTHGFTPDEVAQVQAELDNAYRIAAEKASTRTSDAIAQSVLDNVSQKSVLVHPSELYARLHPFIEGLTSKGLVDALREFWNGAGCAVHVSGPLDLSREQGESAVRAVLEKSSAQPVEAPQAQILEPFAYGQWGKPGAVVEKRVHEKIGVSQLRYANNVRVSFKRTDFEANNIQILIRVGGGRASAPKGKEALALLAETAFLQGGLQKHDFAELERLMALNGARNTLAFQCAEDAFVLRAETSPKTLRFILNCLAAYLTDAAYREEVAGQARQSIEALYRRSEHTLEGAIMDRVSRYLAGGSPLFGLPPKSEALNCSMSELAEWMRPQLAKGYLEISVVGDFEEAALCEAIGAAFGALPVHAEGSIPARKIDFPPPGEKRFFYEGDLPRAVSMAVWPTCDAWDTEKVRALNVLSEIFSDRLRRQIRQKLGEAYSPYAYNRSSETFPGRGMFQAVAALKPESLDAMEKEIVKIAADLHQNGITAGDEFRRAIAPFKTVVQTQLRKNIYWLTGVLARSWEHPELLERPLTLEKGYLEMPPEAVNAVIKDYLSADKAIRIQVAPAEPSSPRAD